MYEIYNVIITYRRGGQLHKTKGSGKSIYTAFRSALFQGIVLDEIVMVYVHENVSGSSYRLPDDKRQEIINRIDRSFQKVLKDIF